ncbi:MAG: hypothetical protein KatS3mg035_2230 [Bacteroidia bacterium]|nr:MAG: hypothetical protein KatS3mg035_2230 [Bacteroidia bacterium]
MTELPLYGSSRLGVIKENKLLKVKTAQNTTGIMSLPIPVNIAQSKNTPKPSVYTMGKKHYESTDWLGNVRVTYTDKKSWQQNKFALSVNSTQDYYPFGSVMEGRDLEINSYRFGFNGMEKDDEWKGKTGTDYDFNGYGYEALIGRRKRTDPAMMEYQSISPYAAFNNNPINNIDPDGKRVRPLNKEAAEGFESHLSSFGKNKEELIKLFHIDYNEKMNVYYSWDLKPLSKKEFFKRAKREGIKIDKEQRESAYSTYLALVDFEVVELETIKTSTASLTYNQGQEGSKIEGEAYNLNVHPSLIRLQSDIKQAGSVRPEIVEELFNPQDPDNPRYPAELRVNNFVFFKGVSPDKAVKGGGGIKGTILIDTTNDRTSSQTGYKIGKALEKLYPNE